MLWHSGSPTLQVRTASDEAGCMWRNQQCSPRTLTALLAAGQPRIKCAGHHVQLLAPMSVLQAPSSSRKSSRQSRRVTSHASGDVWCGRQAHSTLLSHCLLGLQLQCVWHSSLYYSWQPAEQNLLTMQQHPLLGAVLVIILCVA
jgi:hypothetical protein